MCQSSHSSHRSLGTYSVGDCTWISEVEIREKGDRSLGGKEIKKLHWPGYRKKYLFQNKNLLQKPGPFPLRSFTTRLNSPSWLLWRPHSCWGQIFCEKLFAELDLGCQTLRQLVTNTYIKPGGQCRHHFCLEV